jgi:hypothetical protein
MAKRAGSKENSKSELLKLKHPFPDSLYHPVSRLSFVPLTLPPRSDTVPA